jgi:general secretion pathway protein D
MFLRFWVLMLVLCGCQELANRKPLGPAFTKEDALNITKPPEVINPPAPAIKPQEPKPSLPAAFYTPVTITISEGQALKPVLIELARQAGVDLQLDPTLTPKVVYAATQRPFIEVIEQLCDVAGLRYSIKKNTLCIEADTPYSVNYNVQFLNLTRKSQNKASIATDVFSSQNGGKSVGDNGSNTAVNVSGEADFWQELENNLAVILDGQRGKPAPTYSTHKQAGLVTVLASSRYHKLVAAYLQKLRQVSSSQVLIEAKIIEVVLRDEFKSGINWQKVGSQTDWRVSGKFGDKAQASKFLPPSSAQNELVSLGASGQSFSAILNALDEFGYSRTLSSPRLTVMNNQAAILKVAQNQVYFRLHYDKQYNTKVDRESVSVSSDIQTVPIGLVMSVQPSIDNDSGEIILFLRPTVSRLSESVADPAVDIAANATSSTNIKPSLIPVVEVREIDSVLRLKNGEIAIMGGLMEVRSVNDTSKLPFVGDAPLFGDLFKSHTDGNYVVELVILLRASIKEDAPAPDAADTRLQHHMPDPRPF